MGRPVVPTRRATGRQLAQRNGVVSILMAGGLGLTLLSQIGSSDGARNSIVPLLSAWCDYREQIA